MQVKRKAFETQVVGEPLQKLRISAEIIGE